MININCKIYSIIYIKRDPIINEENQTLPQDILRKKNDGNNEITRYKMIINKIRKKQPSSKMREIFVNKDILHGVLEDENDISIPHKTHLSFDSK